VASVAVLGWLGLAIYVGLYLVVQALAVRALQRHFRAFWPALAAASWVALELSRGHFGPGFPWLFLGYTQYRSGGLVQVAAYGGVYAVSFLVFFVGAAAAALGLALLRGRTGSGRHLRLHAVLQLAFAVLLVAAAAARGEQIKERTALTEGPTVGVIQQNIPRLVPELFPAEEPEDKALSEAERTRLREEKERKEEEAAYRQIEDEIETAAHLTARLRGKDVRMVVWPETTVQVPLNLSPDYFDLPPRELEVIEAILGLRFPRFLRQMARTQAVIETTLGHMAALGTDMDCYLLTGAPTYYPRQSGYVTDLRYGIYVRDYGNSAVLFSPQGAFVERYDKIRLVPFGEYIPLRNLLPFLSVFTPITREITPGKEQVIFSLPGRPGEPQTRFGALVCYEDVFPALVRDFRRKGAQFMVNLTDEGWYYIPGELRQHLAMAVFRAVETRTSIVRAANTGISCCISPRGDVYAALSPHVQDALSARILLSEEVTPYVRYGDVFALGCLMLAIALPPVLLVLRRSD
jgi:apolipoprotein N-acyltransferase